MVDKNGRESDALDFSNPSVFLCAPVPPWFIFLNHGGRETQREHRGKNQLE